MEWRKLGRVYCPTGESTWARSYAHLPTPIEIEPGRLRIYFASLDDDRFGRIGFVDVLVSDPLRVIDVATEPALDLGLSGTFDDCGVNPACVLRHGDRWRMYYIGWQRGVRAPYQLFAGLAESSDGRRFKRLSQAPILDRTNQEPFLRSAMSVLPESGRFRAWYVSALGWTTVDGAPYPEYVVRAATSADGVTWGHGSMPCIDLQGDEFGIGRPWVMPTATGYAMWYSIRSRSRPYRIGYAESTDGLAWNRRDDEAGIVAGPEGWDSEMICYPAVIRLGDRTLLFYNGNRHGQSGFGVAERVHA